MAPIGPSIAPPGTTPITDMDPQEEIEHLKGLLSRCLTTIEDAGADALRSANLAAARPAVADGYTEVAATYATLAKEIRTAIHPLMAPTSGKED